jgi:hypothetical protein
MTFKTYIKHFLFHPYIYIKKKTINPAITKLSKINNFDVEINFKVKIVLREITRKCKH